MRKGWLVVVAAVVVMAGSWTRAVFAYDESRADMIARGVTVAGIQVGGMRADEARTALGQELAPRLGRPLTVRHGERSFRLNAANARVAVDFDAMVATAVRESREGTMLARVVRDVGREETNVDVPLEVTYSRAAVAAFVRAVKREVDLDPREARVEPSITALARIPSREGIAVRARVLERRIGARLTNPDARRVLRAPTVVRKPKVSTADLVTAYPHYITVSRSEKKLRYFSNLEVAKVYEIAVGRAGSETPAGLYNVQNKAVNPSWHAPEWAGALAGQVVPPGPTNPIKARWLGIYDGAGIHGTDALSSIGTAASRGCIRMRIPEVIELYDMVPVGTPVYIE